MRSLVARVMTMVTALTFAGMTVAPIATQAAQVSAAPVTIKIRVNEKGFLDEKGKPYGPNRRLTVPKGAHVTLTFVFSEDLSSIAIGDTHQIALRSDDGVTLETDKLWVMSRQSSISFVAGEKVRTRYRAYCILDCVGMEHLTNLLIDVASA